MKVLFDTNVVLDLLLDRAPFAAAAAELISRVETGDLAGYVGATTVTTIHYLAAKVLGAGPARVEIGKLLSIFEVAPVNRPVLEAALDLDLADFEDAVLHEAARQVGAEAIVSRDRHHFKRTGVPAYTAEELLRALALRGEEVHEGDSMAMNVGRAPLTRP